LEKRRRTEAARGTATFCGRTRTLECGAHGAALKNVGEPKPLAASRRSADGPALWSAAPTAPLCKTSANRSRSRHQDVPQTDPLFGVRCLRRRFEKRQRTEAARGTATSCGRTRTLEVSVRRIQVGERPTPWCEWGGGGLGAALPRRRPDERGAQANAAAHRMLTRTRRGCHWKRRAARRSWMAIAALDRHGLYGPNFIGG
jgi:hypothetical protein